jgi:hypothetical protein
VSPFRLYVAAWFPMTSGRSCPLRHVRAGDKRGRQIHHVSRAGGSIGIRFGVPFAVKNRNSKRRSSFVVIDQKKELRNETARGSTAGFGGTGVLMRCEFTDKRYPKITQRSAPLQRRFSGCFGAAFPLDLAAAVLSVSVLSLRAFRVPAALGPLIVCLADRALLPVKLPV